MSDMIASSVLNGWSAIALAECLDNLPMALEEQLYQLGYENNWQDDLSSYDLTYLESKVRQYNADSNYGCF